MSDPQGGPGGAPGGAPPQRGAGAPSVPPAQQQQQQQASSSSSSRDNKRSSSRQPHKSYDMGQVLGNGSFGVVTEARCLETGELVAIKKVLQDPRYKNRELDIMKELHHPNIVRLLDYFYTEVEEDSSSSSSSSSSSRFLNVVMEFVPETVYRVMKTFVRSSNSLPFILVKLYTYQICRSLGYLHALGICHRDVKPQNLLVDYRTHVLKLCDFGSAKRLVPGEQSVAYICSRFYRAPELMLGANEYTTAIDIWSLGCVLGELLLGRPLFAGETSVDQLVKIIQILGTPTQGQMSAMNPNYDEFKFPDVEARDWHSVFAAHQCANDGDKSFEQAVDLMSKLLRYEPNQRLQPLEALAHEFFDELRNPKTTLPGGGALPELFSFLPIELESMSPGTREKCLAAAATKQRPA
ncbi:CMGC kinase, GSK family TgPK3, putative [Eimeria tenella]|uniref:CMGC kinase, GSK family TgPK3, putative n=1 Tax=Eimeria tenella TaxID=5802 RepID=U6KR77_EIMTE|nr:CMGC kinase, GSK family TgPK3, putative [Eimeria tenella]CDJ38884.1 CMGC kinase, GSK family TgPK3, putative [Eimeria tenella]|eukprot:XP_013229639.1 CMGC kinase, GSK family TgPK3, putative [Eimeria tenella]